MSLRKPAILWTFLVLGLFLVYPAASDVITSPSDNRDYLPHQLKNGLRVLLISDPGTDKSAAALDVQVGSGSGVPLPRRSAGLLSQRHDVWSGQLCSGLA